MIDYRKWRHEAVLAYRLQPSVLTKRQRHIFWCVASGMSLKDTAEYLGIAVRTVKDQKQKIKERIPGLVNCASYGALGILIQAEDSKPYSGNVIKFAPEQSYIAWMDERAK